MCRNEGVPCGPRQQFLPRRTANEHLADEVGVGEPEPRRQSHGQTQPLVTDGAQDNYEHAEG